jgi:serine/threonine-protein kinase
MRLPTRIPQIDARRKFHQSGCDSTAGRRARGATRAARFRTRLLDPSAAFLSSFDDLRAALAERYEIERELGRGGMATVYLARDVRHDRAVALKVLHPELAMALGGERFQREIRLAARLQHPHILTVHDSGENGGMLWFTMPYVEGESLRDRLNREKQLPVEDALRIAREAADALDFAHRHGVVHRDVKPENILLIEGHALVADFGIARSLSVEGERLTQTGTSIGTAAYMSPEQAAGEREVDGRSDTYSLGIVLYEMLVGETPFAGPTPEATIARRFTDTARPVRELRNTVPEEMERAVQKALSRTAADRFSSTRAFADALEPRRETSASVAPTTTAVRAARRRKRLPAAFLTLVLGVAIGLGVLFAWRKHGEPAPTVASGPPTIAVLPFENLGDSTDVYFADGVTDAVRGKLTALNGVRVIARGSSEPYRGTTKTPEQIAAELGARYLLTGTVRWAKAANGASRVQVSPELVEVVANGSAQSKWQQSFDAPLTDVFAMQGDIATEVADSMRVALSGTQRARLATVPTAVPEAYDAYLRAEAAWGAGANLSPAALRQAISFYQEAVKLDSTFADAWAQLASASALLYSNSTPTAALDHQAFDAATRAAELDPNGVAGHRALANYYRGVAYDGAKALTEAEAAYRLAPGDATVLVTLASVLASAGRWEEAVSYAKAAYTLDPRTAARPATVTRFYLWMRRPADARPLIDRAMALAPRNPSAAQDRVMVALSAGDLTDARRVLRSATEIPPADLAAYMAIYWDLGWVLDDAGQRLVLSLGPEAFDGDSAGMAIVRAQISGWRGETDPARAWGDRAARLFREQLRESPTDDAQRHSFLGLSLAYAGNFDEAIAEAKRGVAMSPVSVEAQFAPYYMHLLTRVYILAGRKGEALDELEAIMKLHYFLTPAWLKIDPTFAPLRGNPRFERLTAGSGL